MSTPRQMLVCDSPEHAQSADSLICQYLRERDGNSGARWSEIYVKPGVFSDTYGIIWASPGSEVFGDPAQEGFTVETEELDENGGSNWLPLPEADV